MGTGINEYQYNYHFIQLYLETLPLWRRILARYFVKYKVTRKEYDEWFVQRIININNPNHDTTI